MKINYKDIISRIKAKPKIAGIAGAVILVLIICMFRCCGSSEPVIDDPTVGTQIINGCKRVSKVHSSEFKITSRVKHHAEKRVMGGIKLWEKSFEMPIEITFSAYIDLSKFNAGNVIRSKDKITVYLPNPEFEISSIKHGDRSTTSSLFAGYEPAEIDNLIRKKTQSVINNFGKEVANEHSQAVQDARINAYNAILPILEGLGYHKEGIRIVFRNSFNIGELPIHLKI